jgi:RimJ/RimL family protein N-acetyltransferase
MTEDVLSGKRLLRLRRLTGDGVGMNIEIRPLEGRYVRLEPVTGDHRDDLRDTLNCDPEAWEIMAINGCGDGFADWWEQTLAGKRRSERITYAIRQLSDDRVVGTTSFLNIRPMHKGLEIGSTFLHPDVRSGPVNPESKRLLLGHAFDCGAIRAEFRIDDRNSRSQAAVLKLGAIEEGTLRRHMITWTGHVRDTTVFSITDMEWPAVRQRLDFRLTESFV